MTIRQILHNHKPKLILLSVGVFISLLLNSEVFYLPQNTTTKIPTELSNKVEEPKPKPASGPRKITDVTITNTYIRENLYYTQGLTFKDSNTIIESAGLYQKSAILYLDASTMKVLDSKPINPKYFGEGCEYVKRGDIEEIYQLTWRERKIVVWDAKDLSIKKELDLPREIREGWGIVKRYEKDESGNEVLNFYVSDGTHKIFIVDAETWKVKKTLMVQKQKNEIVRNLNELEFVHGKLWANVYFSNLVAVIDPETGMVEAMIDLSQFIKLAQEKSRELKTPWQQDYVLNGIAYDETKDRLIVTGKNWPLMWEIKVQGL